MYLTALFAPPGFLTAGMRPAPRFDVLVAAAEVIWIPFPPELIPKPLVFLPALRATTFLAHAGSSIRSEIPAARHTPLPLNTFVLIHEESVTRGRKSGR